MDDPKPSIPPEPGELLPKASVGHTDTRPPHAAIIVEGEGSDVSIAQSDFLREAKVLERRRVYWDGGNIAFTGIGAVTTAGAGFGVYRANKAEDSWNAKIDGGFAVFFALMTAGIGAMLRREWNKVKAEVAADQELDEKLLARAETDARFFDRVVQRHLAGHRFTLVK